MGRVASTVHVRLAGVASVWPAASTARACSVCSPSASPLSAYGVPHDVHVAAESSRHWNVEPALVDVNVSVALRLLVSSDGPDAIVVSGTVKTVQLRVAGVL